MTFISEIRCGKVKAEKRIKSLPLCNSEIVASNGLSGGLWLLWDDSCTVTILSKNKNLIATEINEKVPINRGSFLQSTETPIDPITHEYGNS